MNGNVVSLLRGPQSGIYGEKPQKAGVERAYIAFPYSEHICLTQRSGDSAMKQASRGVNAPLSVQLHPGDHRWTVGFPHDGPAISGWDYHRARRLPPVPPEAPFWEQGVLRLLWQLWPAAPASSRHGLCTRWFLSVENARNNKEHAVLLRNWIHRETKGKLRHLRNKQTFPCKHLLKQV